jgi:hypothetical protein
MLERLSREAEASSQGLRSAQRVEILCHWTIVRNNASAVLEAMSISQYSVESKLKEPKVTVSAQGKLNYQFISKVPFGLEFAARSTISPYGFRTIG